MGASAVEYLSSGSNRSALRWGKKFNLNLNLISREEKHFGRHKGSAATNCSHHITSGAHHLHRTKPKFLMLLLLALSPTFPPQPS